MTPDEKLRDEEPELIATERGVDRLTEDPTSPQVDAGAFQAGLDRDDRGALRIRGVWEERLRIPHQRPRCGPDMLALLRGPCRRAQHVVAGPESVQAIGPARIGREHAVG